MPLSSSPQSPQVGRRSVMSFFMNLWSEVRRVIRQDRDVFLRDAEKIDRHA
jgi:hypothetical protein